MFKTTSILVLALASVPAGWPRPKMPITTSPSAISNWWKAACRKVPKLTVAGDSHRQQAMIPYAVLDSDGEAYLTGLGSDGNWFSAAQVVGAMGQLHVLFRAPAGKEVQGRLILPKADATGMEVLRFAVPPSAAKAEAKEPFYRAKLAHYDNLLSRDIPGGAWFRHRRPLRGPS